MLEVLVWEGTPKTVPMATPGLIKVVSQSLVWGVN